MSDIRIAALGDKTRGAKHGDYLRLIIAAEAKLHQ
jgi:hypothetical protein